MESDDESDSPDSIVPASSPESVLGEELLRFPLLSEAKPELEERVLSPIIPIIPRASIPGGMGQRDVWSRAGVVCGPRGLGRRGSVGCAAQGGGLEHGCQVGWDMDGAGGRSWSRRRLRESREESLGSVGCEGKGSAGWRIPSRGLGQLGGLMGGSRWGWVCTVLTLALTPLSTPQCSPTQNPMRSQSPLGLLQGRWGQQAQEPRGRRARAARSP